LHFLLTNFQFHIQRVQCIQALEEEKKNLDEFCDQSLKNALIQERRRYGFVLERYVQSLAKHWLQYHNVGHSSLESNIELWNEMATSRESLPMNAGGQQVIMPNSNNNSSSINKMESRLDEDDEDEDDDEDDRDSLTSVAVMKKSDAAFHESNSGSVAQIPRASSEFNISSSQEKKWNGATVTALFAYLSSGDNQLSFYEGDKIALVGDKVRGWQFGENLRTEKFGWFPISYVQDDSSRYGSQHCVIIKQF